MKSESTEKPISLSFKPMEEVLKEFDKNKKYKCNQSDYQMHIIPFIEPHPKGVIQHFLIDFAFNFRYVGLVSREFKREFFGANYYHQQDIYIGEWKENQRHGYGMYIYNYQIATDKRIIYFGQYSDGVKEGNGMLIWKNSNSLNSRLIDDSFDAFIGAFKQGQAVSGVYFTQVKTGAEFNQIAYIGKLVNDKRTDKEGRIIDITNSRLAVGNYEDSVHTLGYIIQYCVKDTQVMVNDVFNFDINREEKFYPYEKIPEIQREDLEKTTNAIVNDFTQKRYWDAIDAYYHKMLSLANECQYLEAFKSLNIESVNFISELKAFEEIYHFE